MPLFVAIAALIVLREEADRDDRRAWTAATVFMIVALTITHHLTAYLLVALLAAIAVAQAIAGRRLKHYDVWRIAVFAFAATIGWLVIVASETVGYLTPVLITAFRDTVNTLTGAYAVRAPFQGGAGGAVTPFGDKLLTYAYLLILAAALPLGLRAIWRAQRRDPIALLLALGGLSFFGALALRLSPSAWEIGNRLDAFLFLGLAFVVAWAVVDQLETASHRHLVRPSVVAGAAVVVTIGGALTGWEASAILSAPTVVRVDGHDIPSETLALARWTRAHLTGPPYTAASLADGRAILLYGNGRVYMGATGDITDLLGSADVSQTELDALRALGVRYVVVDQRSRRDDDVAGYGFSVDASGGSPDVLLPDTLQSRLDQMGAARIYDSGRIAIYDLGGIL
jgi:hypothetical protein